jgi:hypothetical protein
MENQKQQAKRVQATIVFHRSIVFASGYSLENCNPSRGRLRRNPGDVPEDYATGGSAVDSSSDCALVLGIGNDLITAE